MMCFRYYSGLSFSCLAQSEPMDIESVYKETRDKTKVKESVKKRDLPRPGDLIRLRSKHASNCSSESESEPESSSKYRKKGWRLLKKKSSLPNGFLHQPDKEDSDTDSSRTSSKDLPTWNSHEAQRTLDVVDQHSEYFPIWSQKSPVKTSAPSVYETVFPTNKEIPPPLPPRSYPPRHRPLERTRAICGLRRPPEVLRKNKPCEGPTLPPRPKKITNPEDSFGFEIVDTDELSNASSLQSMDRTQEDNGERPSDLLISSDGQECPAPLATPEHDNSLADNNGMVDRSPPVASTSQGASCTEQSLRTLTVPEQLASPSPISPCTDSGVVMNTSSEGATVVTHSSSSDSLVSASDEPIQVRSHRPLSRQASHPPGAVRIAAAATSASSAAIRLPQCPPTPTHHARHPNRSALSSPLLPRHQPPPPPPPPPPVVVQDDVMAAASSSDINMDGAAAPCSTAAGSTGDSTGTIRHITSTRLPSIPERSIKLQRVETTDEDPLPPCK